jgi:hypothetical protein
MVMVPLAVGELELPPVTVSVRDQSGSRQVRSASSPVVSITSVLPEDEAPEPAPLRDPLGVGGFPWEWVVPLSVPMLVVVSLLAMLGRRMRGSHSVAGSPAEAPPLDELEAVLVRLEERVGCEPAEGICDRLAFALRHYLQRQSGRPAEDMTSFELRQLVRKLQWPDETRRGVLEVTATVDRVRFAREAADEHELRQALAIARTLARAVDEHLLAQAALEDAETAA